MKKTPSIASLILTVSALALFTAGSILLSSCDRTPENPDDTQPPVSSESESDRQQGIPTTDSKDTVDIPLSPVTDPPVTGPTDETTGTVTTPPITTEPPISSDPNQIKHVYAGSLPASEDAGDSWFSDALFLGDSRTVGLANYSGIPSTYYAKTSLNIFTAFTEKFLDDNGTSYTILEKIEKDGQVYSKVYLWFGLNELGYAQSTVVNMYRKMITQLRELLPNAQIYVISIVPVSQKTSDTSPYGVTNENVYKFNTAFAAMAKDMGVYFVNAAEDFSDDTGALRAQTRDGKTISLDGIHFGTAAVKEFFAYLRTHTAAQNA